jgi:hypothetical protein
LTVELSSTEDAVTAPWALVAAAVLELVFSVSGPAKKPSVAFAVVDDERIAFNAALSSAELNALKAA